MNLVYKIWYENQLENIVWTTAQVPPDMMPSEISDRMMNDPEVVRVTSMEPVDELDYSRDFTI